MKTLTTEQIETLKKLKWDEALYGENNNYFLAPNLDDADFLQLTGFDLEILYDSIYLPVSNRIEYYKSSVYKNGEKFFLQYTVFVDGVEWASGNFAMFEGDLLGLYTPKEEPTEEQTENPIEKLRQALNDCANDVSIDTADVVAAIKEFDYLYDVIKEKTLEDVSPSELPDSLFDDVVDDYLENNPNDCFDRIKDDVDDDTIKDFVKDYINDNL